MSSSIQAQIVQTWYMGRIITCHETKGLSAQCPECEWVIITSNMWKKGQWCNKRTQKKINKQYSADSGPDVGSYVVGEWVHQQMDWRYILPPRKAGHQRWVMEDNNCRRNRWHNQSPFLQWKNKHNTWVVKVCAILGWVGNQKLWVIVIYTCSRWETTTSVVIVKVLQLQASQQR